MQFADRGFPLLGDQVYGQKSEILDRQALHAEVLGFRHPITDEPVTVTSPLPKDMEEALKILRTQRRVERAEAGIQGEEGIFKPKITKGRKLERVRRAQRYAGEGEGETERPTSREPRSGERPGRKYPQGAPSGARPRSSAAPKGRPESASGPRKGPASGPRKGSAAGPRKGNAPVRAFAPKRSK